MEKVINLEPLASGNAPEASKKILDATQSAMGMIPNMYTIFAHSPALFTAYSEGYKAFRELSGFSPAEQEVIFLTVSKLNGCHYCEAAHSFLANTSSNVPADVVEAILNETEIADEKLRALYSLTKSLVNKKGWLNRQDIEAFLNAGYSEKNVLDVIAGIGTKIFSNYMNHLAQTPIDELFNSQTKHG